MREQLFIGKIRLQRRSGEKYQRRLTCRVLQTAFNIRLQVVLIAKPLAEVLRLFVVHIVQTDFPKLPVSE